VDAIERVTRDVASMTKDEKLEIIRKDSPELIPLLDALKEKVAELKEKIHPLIRRVRDGQLSTSNGISYLEVKYRTFSSNNLSHTLLPKETSTSLLRWAKLSLRIKAFP